MSLSHEHPLFDELFRLIDQSDYTPKEIARRAGSSTTTLQHWRGKEQVLPKARVDTFDRWLRVLGYKLAIVPVTPYNSNDE